MVDINRTIVDILIAPYRPFHYCKSETVSLSFNLNTTNDQCQYDRSGVLCGGCQSGFSLVLGSSKCRQCQNTYLLLLLSIIAAGVVIVIFIKILNLTVSSGTINGVVFYANIVKANQSILFPQQDWNILTMFIS